MEEGAGMIDLLEKIVHLETLELSRRAGQVKLGDLIVSLAKAVLTYGEDVKVRFSDGTHPGDFMSYRGYYDMLALGRGEVQKAESLLLMAKGARGHTFTGYKGGEYRMEDYTPIWVSEYGECSGEGIVGIELDDWEVVLVLGQVEE